MKKKETGSRITRKEKNTSSKSEEEYGTWKRIERIYSSNHRGNSAWRTYQWGGEFQSYDWRRTDCWRPSANGVNPYNHGSRELQISRRIANIARYFFHGEVTRKASLVQK